MENFIKSYWEAQARSYGDSHWASWGDRFMINLEISTISTYIKESDSVLDVGCANGYSAFEQNKKKKLGRVVGVDFAENMINEARVASKKLNVDNIDFEVGDICGLRFPDESFDVVYTTRVLINLASWDEQLRGIKECIRVAKKGGVIVFSEAFWEPLVLLNSIRQLLGLVPLVEHDFNRYLKKPKLESYLNETGYSFEVNEFSSIYYLGTRVLRELVGSDNLKGYHNAFNEEFYNLEQRYSAKGLGIQQAYILYKG